MQEIEATLRQSAQSTEGLIEAARILSTLKMATNQAQAESSAGHASNAAFAEGIAQHADQRVHDSSERHEQHMHTGTGSHRQNAGTCNEPLACLRSILDISCVLTLLLMNLDDGVSRLTPVSHNQQFVVQYHGVAYVHDCQVSFLAI